MTFSRSLSRRCVLFYKHKVSCCYFFDLLLILDNCLRFVKMPRNKLLSKNATKLGTNFQDMSLRHRKNSSKAPIPNQVGSNFRAKILEILCE